MKYPMFKVHIDVNITAINGNNQINKVITNKNR